MTCKLTLILLLSCVLLLSACKKEYSKDFVKWGEKTNSNTTELLEKNNIPYKIIDGMIYIPEDAFDHAIYCCA